MKPNTYTESTQSTRKRTFITRFNTTLLGCILAFAFVLIAFISVPVQAAEITSSISVKTSTSGATETAVIEEGGSCTVNLTHGGKATDVKYELSSADSTVVALSSDTVTLTELEGSFSIYGISAGETTVTASFTSSGSRRTYTAVITVTVISTVEEELCEHQWTESNVILPTCTESGYTEYICIVCGAIEQDNVIEALGHQLGSDNICAICGYSKPNLVYTAFGSDLHGKTSTLSNILSQIQAADIEPESIGFVGDTEQAASSVRSAVNSYFGNTGVFISYGTANHDSYDGLNNMTGELCNTDSYILYAISGTVMQSSSISSTYASEFTSYVSNLSDSDRSKVLMIMTHVPLHSRRNDNKGADTWLQAINDAAEKMDIVVLWAHNHTGESSSDTANYLVSRGGTITSFNGSQSTGPYTINFTYMNAGYISPTNTPARVGYMNVIGINNSTINLQGFTAAGVYTGNYANSKYVSASENTEISSDGSVVTFQRLHGEVVPVLVPGSGDVVEDGIIDVMDVVVLKQYIYGNYSPVIYPEERILSEGDLNADGRIDETDAWMAAERVANV